MHRKLTIFDLQPISRESPDNVARPLHLVPTIELIKHSFVPHHQHDQCTSQEFYIYIINLGLPKVIIYYMVISILHLMLLNTHMYFTVIL